MIKSMWHYVQPLINNQWLVSCLYCSFFGAYSMDVLAGCALSVDMDSFRNPSNPFIVHASKFFRISIPLFFFQGTTLHVHATSLSLYWYKQLWLITFYSSFPFQGCFQSLFLSWSYWVHPCSLSLQLVLLKRLWKRSKQNATGAHIRFGQNTQERHHL